MRLLINDKLDGVDNHAYNNNNTHIKFKTLYDVREKHVKPLTVCNYVRIYNYVPC